MCNNYVNKKNGSYFLRRATESKRYCKKKEPQKIVINKGEF